MLLLALWADQPDARLVPGAAAADRRGLRADAVDGLGRVQNVVERHHLGIAFGTMNFSRNLFSTILIAILGALVLAATSSLGPGARRTRRHAAAGQRRSRRAFRRVFFAVAACLCISFIAVVMMEQRPLRTDLPAGLSLNVGG